MQYDDIFTKSSTCLCVGTNQGVSQQCILHDNRISHNIRRCEPRKRWSVDSA